MMQNNSELSYPNPTINNIELPPLVCHPGTEFKANYLVENEIGRGRFAKVCRVRHKENENQYAAKIIRRKKNGLDTSDAIKREVDILHLSRNISSIVNIHGVFETKLDVTLLLEYSSGGDLYHLVIDLDDNLAEDFVIGVIRQLLSSIAFLHSKSIVHLDIKPENILLKSPYPSSRVALCDFGLAKILEENTMLRELVGTPDYVAPEILDYSPIQLVSDVWSTGCVTYFLLTSISPFNGPTKEETYSNVSQVKVDYSPDIFQDISTHAVDFIQKVIKKSPKDRPSVFTLQEHSWIAGSDISRTSDSAEDSRESSNDLEICDGLANVDIEKVSNSTTIPEARVVSEDRSCCEPAANHYNLLAYVNIVTIPFKSQSNLTADQLYCQNYVRRYDYENYLCTLLLPKANRDYAFAIRAFSVELAMVKSSVKDLNIAQMRFQFWKEAVDSILQGKPNSTPVMLEMAKNTNFSKLSKRWLYNMVEARLTHFNEKAFENMKAVENYGEMVNSSSHYLIAESIQASSPHIEHALSHLGKAQGIVNILRGVPFMVRNQKILLPSDLMLKHGVSQEVVFRGRGTDPKLSELAYDIASVSSQHLEMCSSIIKNNELKRSAKILFLPIIATRAYLTRLQEMNFNLFASQLNQRDGFLPARLWWTKLKGTP